MLTLPQKIKQDLRGGVTNTDYLVAIKANPTIYISTTPQMFDSGEGERFDPDNLIRDDINIRLKE